MLASPRAFGPRRHRLGLLTATRATRRDPRDTLPDAGRGQAGAVEPARRPRHRRRAVRDRPSSCSLAPRCSAGACCACCPSIPGFRTEGLVAMDLALPSSDDPAAKARLSPFYADIFSRLRAIPGVEEVAAANAVPLDGGLPDGMFLRLAPQDAPREAGRSPAALPAEGPHRHGGLLRGVAGLLPRPRHPAGAGPAVRRARRPRQPHAALVNESLARSRWPGDDPIGRTIEFGNMDGDLRPLTIVGIVGDTREYGLEQPPRPTLYVNLMQRPRFSTTVVMRHGGGCRHGHRGCAPRAARSGAGRAAAIPHLRRRSTRRRSARGVQSDAWSACSLVRRCCWRSRASTASWRTT